MCVQLMLLPPPQVLPDRDIRTGCYDAIWDGSEVARTPDPGQ